MGFLQKQPWQPRTLMDVDVIALANGIRPGGGREEECLTQARNVLDLADRFAPGLKEGGWRRMPVGERRAFLRDGFFRIVCQGEKLPDLGIVDAGAARDQIIGIIARLRGS